MTSPHEDVSDRIARLGRATEAIRPSAGFTARVMGLLEVDQPMGWLDLVGLSSRRLLPVAALAAAVAVGWAVQSQSSADDALAVSYGAVELEW
jgi:hypothetical protein